MKRNLLFRPYESGDEEGILELWQAVYPERAYITEDWMKWWQWKYRENPAGNGIIWLAEDASKIVGHYTVIPVVMKISTEENIVCQSVDTMTHPDYRRQGIFEALAKQTYAVAHARGTDVVYGFPNRASYPGFVKKLSWFKVATKRMLVRPLNWRNTLRGRIRNNFLVTLTSMAGNLLIRALCATGENSSTENLTVTRVSCFDERINHFWSRVSRQHDIMVVRNKEYLNWRYGSVPGVEYLLYVAERAGEICGYLVLRYMQREYSKVCIICDILAQSEAVAYSLVASAVERCKQDNIGVVYCSLLAGKTYIAAFTRNGFLSAPFFKGHLLCAYSHPLYGSKELLMDSKNWFILIGDSDII